MEVGGEAVFLGFSSFLVMRKPGLGKKASWFLGVNLHL